MTMKWTCPSPEVNDILDTEGVICCVGTGRSGKTTLAHLLASKSVKPVYCVNYPDDMIDLCPDHFHSISLKETFLLKDCVLLIDDAAVWLSSMNYEKNLSKSFGEFLTIISHKNITVIIAIQNMGLLLKSALKSQRMVVLYKYSDLNNIKSEREEYMGLAMFARHAIRICRELRPLDHPKSFVYDTEMGQVWRYPIAEHWCDALSKPYRDYEVRS